MDTARVPIPLDTIRAAYSELGRLVHVDLRTQLGDSARLGERRRECLNLLHLVRQHIRNIPRDEFQVIESSIHNMVACLDQASQISNDVPDAPPPSTSELTQTGRPGRPRIEINPELLQIALDIRGGPTSLGTVFGCHPRTVRRRALEQGLVEPCSPVYVDYERPDGTITRIYRSSTRAATDMDDTELDEVMISILEAFPTYGRRMIDGHLRFLGHHIPRSRIQGSYARVHGAPSSGFGPRRIQRRVYNVAGPNSLWHHDGQHGLIRWKIVFHGFIDGYSRLVTGIRASNNNRAETVHVLFTSAVEQHGLPSRVRGDYGTENVLVRSLMESLRGIGRGSYILGRSVHNVRIERLWRDLTLGFGAKWKLFFQGLELHDRLNPDSDSHIWLLHHLFLVPINNDALDWAQGWNGHSITLRDRRQASPRDLFFFGTLENGSRGFALTEEPEDEQDILAYGIDWDAFDDPQIHAHHDAQNAPGAVLNPFQTQNPTHMSHVEVEEPISPFTPEQLAYLDQQLYNLPFFNSRSMDDYRHLWIFALQTCETMFGMP